MRKPKARVPAPFVPRPFKTELETVITASWCGSECSETFGPGQKGKREARKHTETTGHETYYEMVQTRQRGYRAYRKKPEEK